MGSLKQIEKFHDELTLWRRDIHATLRFYLKRTALAHWLQKNCVNLGVMKLSKALVAQVLLE